MYEDRLQDGQDMVALDKIESIERDRIKFRDKKYFDPRIEIRGYKCFGPMALAEFT